MSPRGDDLGEAECAVFAVIHGSRAMRDLSIVSPRQCVMSRSSPMATAAGRGRGACPHGARGRRRHAEGASARTRPSWGSRS